MSVFQGSENILVSTENQDILMGAIQKPFGSFSFVNTEICHIKVNGGNPIYLAAGQGFDYEHNATLYRNPPLVSSLVIVEADINYQWIGL